MTAISDFSQVSLSLYSNYTACIVILRTVVTSQYYVKFWESSYTRIRRYYNVLNKLILRFLAIEIEIYILYIYCRN